MPLKIQQFLREKKTTMLILLAIDDVASMQQMS